MKKKTKLNDSLYNEAEIFLAAHLFNPCNHAPSFSFLTKPEFVFLFFEIAARCCCKTSSQVLHLIIYEDVFFFF